MRAEAVSQDREIHNRVQIHGPQTAFFWYYGQSYSYDTITSYSLKPEGVAIMEGIQGFEPFMSVESAIHALHDELDKYLETRDGVVVWRVQPEVQEHGGRYYARCRLFVMDVEGLSVGDLGAVMKEIKKDVPPERELGATR